VDAASLPSGATGALPETCRSHSPAGTPVILDAGSRALYLGPSFTLAGHRNTVAVLAFGLDGDFALQGENDRAPARQRTPSDAHPVSMHAELAGCAVSTFQRRFTGQAGLPWRRWRLWQRLRHAAKHVCEGGDLTTAAHAAGFASGAHFSDAFKATFGLPPIRLVDWGVAWRAIARRD
jgi:AraC-like DNA-binding protein